MNDLLQPKNDFVFKRIFASEGNKDVLLAFLNAVFESAHGQLLTEIEVLNSYLDKDAVWDKQSILDIRARASNGMLINIEIQLLNQRDIEKRTLFYWAKLYSGQLEEGAQYRNLNKTVTINILDFDYIVNNEYHNTFHLREDRTNILLAEDIEIHFIELRKLKEQSYELERRLVKWALFLRGVSQERLEELAMQEPELKKAMTTLEFLSQDAESRRLYEARQKALHDEASMIAGAREEGIQQGREEGRYNERREFAKKMLSKGASTKEVAEMTGLSEADVDKLTQQQN